jgi:purine-binding chemotaxis protein CheW
LEITAVRSIGRLHQYGFQATLEGVATPPGAIGWLAAQAHQYPVFDLAAQLGVASAATSNLHEGFVVLVNTAAPFGLRVDRVIGNLEVEPAQIAALPHILEPSADKLFKGVVKLADKWLLCADASKLHRTQAVPTTTLSTAAPHAPNALAAPRKTRAQILLFSSAQKLNATNEAQPMVFGLSLTQVQEISNLLPILPVPHAPKYVFGLTNWRNLPLPIIDLQARLGLPHEAVAPNQIHLKSRLLIARAPSGLVGVPIHPQVKAFPLPIPYQAHQQPLSVARNLVLGMFDLEGSPLVIPDLDAMLTRNFAPQP